jgi:hypothetical protein
MPGGSSCFIPYLNGGLFDEDAIDRKLEGFTLPDALFHHPDFEDVPEDKYNRSDKRGFLDFLDAFNFTIHEDSPEDKTIGVDPEMLGHIFENLLEDNKEKGAFYTPKPIVHFMCQESLIEYLNTELEGDDELRGAIEELIKKQETASVDHLFEEILTALQTVKVCDPAIGSGAFPMGILQEIYQTVETIFYASRDDVDATWGLDKGDLNAADIKKQIIQHSIYGVDIEQGAVDIARLRFWLSLIVDEEKPTPLPNLEYKIVSGNSLISTLWLDGSEQAVEINWELEGEVEGTKKYLDELREILKTTVQKQQQYFSTDKAHGAALKEDIKELKIDALITQLKFDRYYYEQTTADQGGALPSAKDKKHNLNRQIKTAEYSDTIKKLQQLKENDAISFNHFDWKLDFPEVLNPVMAGKEAGFDIILGNPPYGLNISEALKEFLRDKYNQLEFKIDMYSAFYLAGMNLLQDDGFLIYINPSTLMDNYYEYKIRNELLNNNRVIHLIELDDQVFDSAIVHSMILSFKKCSPEKNYDIKCMWSKKLDSNYKRIPRSFFQQNERLEFNLRYFEDIDTIKKINQYTIKLGEVIDLRQAIKSGNDKKFIKQEKVNNNYKPILKGKHIKKWQINNPNLYLEYGSHLSCPRDEKIFNQPKILVREAGKQIIATYDENNFYIMSSIYNGILINENYLLKYVLGLLNSNVLQYMMKLKTFDKTKGAFTKAKIYHYEELPIKRCEKNIQIHFKNVVDKILKYKSQEKGIEVLEKKLDMMSFKLYGLSYSEVNIIIENTGGYNISQDEYESFELEVGEVAQ